MCIQNLDVEISLKNGSECFLNFIPDLLSQHIDETLKTSQFQGGVIVHLGSQDGKRTAELYNNENTLVQGLDTSIDNIKIAGKYINSKKMDAKVSIKQFDGKNLPYVSNMVNLLVVDDN